MVKPCRNVESLWRRLVLSLDRQHDLVERGHRSADVLAKGNGEIGRVASGLGDAQLALRRRFGEQIRPQDEEDSCSAGQNGQA